MNPADLIQELLDKHDAWQRQCDGWIANAESLGGGIDAATIERMRRTVYGEAADTLASKDTALAEIRAELARLGEVEAAARNLLTLLLCVDFDRFTEHDELLLETVLADARTFLGTPAISQDDVEERR